MPWIDVEQKDNWVDVEPTQTNKWVDVEPSKPTPVSQLLFQPISKTLTGKSLGERTDLLNKQYQGLQKQSDIKALQGKPTSALEFFLKSLPASTAQTGVELADISPFDIALMAGTAGLAKVPIRGISLGEAISKVPIGKGFMGKVGEMGRYQDTLKAITPLSSRGVPNLNPVQKITQALQEAVPIRGQQEALYTAERAKRAGAIVEAGQTVPGEQGYFAQLGALKGELPKVQFESLRGKVGQSDIDSLFNIVEQNGILSPYEKISTKTGLAKLLGSTGGSVPTEGELKLLSKVFPPDFIKATLSKRPLMQKMFEGAEEVLNVPRAVMASADMSAPLRQGLFLIGRPKQWLPAFRDMFKYAFNEKSYQGLMEDIAKRPTYDLMKQSGLSITDIGTTLSSREEKFMSNLAERIPVLGHIVRGSNRAYTGFLNKLRADTFDDMVSSAQRLGLKPEGKLLTDIGNFISTATGRGKLPQALERSAVALNFIFFSPRLMASRINLLRPDYYIRLDPLVRKEALKSLFTLAGVATTTISLAKMGGAEVGTDPRSADFGKMKFGDTRYDILGGFQQYIRLAAQLATGEHISSTTGVKTTVGEGYKPINRVDIVGRFLETKEAPVVTFALGLFRGQSSLGKQFNIPSEVGARFTPMVIQDMVDLYKEKGLQGLGMAVPGIFGAGLQTYSPTPSEIVYSTNSVKSHTRELLKEGRVDEAKKLYLRNEKLVKIGEKLEPYQKEISKLEKAKEILTKNITITPEQKKVGLTYADKMIKKFGTKMLERYKEIK